VTLRRTFAALPALVAGALLLPAAAAFADAAPGRPAPSRVAAPWATVNVCDSSEHPDGVGIRGSMPGTGDRRDVMFMRIQLQFLRRADGRWHGIGRRGDSGLLATGRGDVRARQAGRTFTVTPPPAGRPPYLLRGLVTFEWRRGGQLIRRARRVTQGGHAGTTAAEPPGFSAATCAIR
jgi:hypothetical protein